MCKLFIAAGAFPRKVATRIIEETVDVFGKTQTDGFGYVAYGGGKIATSRHLNPAGYVAFGEEMPAFIDGARAEDGEMPEVVTALLIHGRTSTNRVCIENVHPFTAGRLRLAHNGILNWKGAGPEPGAENGCDSESFLNWMLSFKNYDAAWAETEANWSGYGVFGIVDAKRKSLTVAKCGSGKLAWTRGTYGHMFSTDAGDLTSIARMSGLKSARPADVRSGTVSTFRIAGETASLVRVSEWAGFGSFVRDTSYYRSYGTGAQGTGCGFASGAPSTVAHKDWRDYNRSLPRNPVAAAVTTNQGVVQTSAQASSKPTCSVTGDDLTEEEVEALVADLRAERDEHNVVPASAKTREMFPDYDPEWSGR